MIPKPAHVGPITIKPMRDEIRFIVGSADSGLRFLKFRDLRTLADALHDLADDIDQQKEQA